MFDHCKQIGDVGIPAFVFEDGRVSIDPADAGLVEYGSSIACSIADGMEQGSHSETVKAVNRKVSRGRLWMIEQKA